MNPIRSEALFGGAVLLGAIEPLELFALAPLGGERGRERGTPSHWGD